MSLLSCTEELNEDLVLRRAYFVETDEILSAEDAEYRNFYGGFRCIKCGSLCHLVKAHERSYDGKIAKVPAAFHHDDDGSKCSLRSDFAPLATPNTQSFTFQGQSRKKLYQNLTDVVQTFVENRNYDVRTPDRPFTFAFALREFHILYGPISYKKLKKEQPKFLTGLSLLFSCPYAMRLIYRFCYLLCEKEKSGHNFEINWNRQQKIVGQVLSIFIQSMSHERYRVTKQKAAHTIFVSVFKEKRGYKSEWTPIISSLDEENLKRFLKDTYVGETSSISLMCEFMYFELVRVFFYIDWQKLLKEWQH